MKNIKDLIIASALGIMVASCYAGSLVPNTSTGVSADVNFSNPGQLQAQLTPVSGLVAGPHKGDEAIYCYTFGKRFEQTIRGNGRLF